MARKTTPDWDTIVSYLPGLYPLCLILGVVVIPGGNLLLRLGLLLAAVPGVLRMTDVRRTHRRFFVVIGAYLAVIAVASFSAVDPSIALIDLFRQMFLIVVAAGLSLALTTPQARTAFAVGSVVVAAVAALSILSLYASFAGSLQSGPVQESFKAYAAELGGFENAMAFAVVLAAVLAAPYLARRPAILALFAVAMVLAVAVSGSRTAAASLIVCVPLTAALLLLDRIPRVPRWISVSALVVIAGWAVITFADRLGRLAVSPELNDLTTGRSVLWAAAWSKFVERPLFGWGGGSFPIDLTHFLPATSQIYPDDKAMLASAQGGAHNALLAVLAERGLVAAVAAIVVSGFLLALGVSLFRARSRLAGIDRSFAMLAPFGVVAILLRSLGEAPGWFGLADGLVDFLAYGFAAMLVAVASTLDPIEGRAWQRAKPEAPIGIEPAGRVEAGPVTAPIPARTGPDAGTPRDDLADPGALALHIVEYTHAAGSGAAQYVASLSGALSARGVKVELLCPADFMYAQDVSGDRVRITKMTASLAMANGRAAKLRRTVAQSVVGAVVAARAANRSRLVHMNFVGIPLFAVPVIAYLRWRGLRVILTVHDVVPHRALLPRYLSPFERFALRLQYRAPDHLIVHYRAAASELARSFSIPSARITVIPHGAKIPEGGAIRDPSDRTIRVAVLGSLRANKGVHLAIRAVQELRARGVGVELVIAGLPDRSESAYWRDCEALIARAPDGIRVESTFVSDARMQVLLLGCDAVLLPYASFEAQSGVAIDAIAAARPIIATSAGGLGELLERSGAGIRISSASKEAVRAAIEEAVELGRPALAALGAAGAAYVRDELDWRRVADRHVALFARLTLPR